MTTKADSNSPSRSFLRLYHVAVEDEEQQLSVSSSLELSPRIITETKTVSLKLSPRIEAAFLTHWIETTADEQKQQQQKQQQNCRNQTVATAAEVPSATVENEDPFSSLVSTSLLMRLNQERQESFDSLILIEEDDPTELSLVQHDRDRHQENQNAANMKVRAGSTNSSSNNNKRMTNEVGNDDEFTPANNINDDADKDDEGDNIIYIAANTDSDNDRSSDNNSETNSSRVRKYMEFIQKFRHQCGMAVNNEYVQFTMIAFIIINALMMGIATFDFIKDDDTNKEAFDVTDRVFLWIFTIELAMQFFYHGFQLLLDGWLVFDLIIISISWIFAEVQIVRAFRIFRAFRLITRIKIMRDLILGK